MFFAEPVNFADTRKTAGKYEFNIVSPSSVRVRDTEGVRSAIFAYSEDGTWELVNLSVPERVYAKPGTAKHEKELAVETSAKDAWKVILANLEVVAESTICDPTYVSHMEQITTWVTADITSRVNQLVKDIEMFKKRINDGWFEFGTSSTASAGNMEMEIAVAQGQLSAVVDTYDGLFQPYVDARRIARKLLEVASTTLQVRLRLR